MNLNAQLVLPTSTATWLRQFDLPFAPHPGLGIRLDVYECVNVTSVVVGDYGYDVTCIVELELEGREIELARDEEWIAAKCSRLGFEIGSYP